MIAAIYARYSSDNQREESIVAQLRACREYCARRGYNIIKEYADEAMTGTNDRRPQFQQMIADAEAGLFEILVAHKVDRLGRNEYDYYTNRHKLNNFGVDIHFAAQGFDTSTPEGALLENQLAGLAAFYSRNLSKEVKKGLKENVLQGKSTGGKPLFGYRYTDDKRYEIDEVEAVAVRLIFQEYIAGKGYIEIAKMLNSRGYRTRLGNLFSKNSLHDLIVNRRYIGTAILGKNKMNRNGKRNSHRPDHDDMLIIENVCPAIVSDEVFQAAQAEMQNRKKSRGKNSKRHSYPLAGLIVCGCCGSSYIGSTSGGKSGTYRFYRCCQKNRKGADTCPNTSLVADKIEAAAANFIKDIFSDPNRTVQLVDKVLEKYSQEQGVNIKSLETLERRVNGIKQKIKNFYAFIESTGVMDDMQTERYKQLTAELDVAQKELAEAENASVGVPLISREEILKFIQKSVSESSENPDTLKAVVSSFIEKIVVTPDGIEVRYQLPLYHLCGALGGKHSKMIYLFRLHLDRNYKQVSLISFY